MTPPKSRQSSVLALSLSCALVALELSAPLLTSPATAAPPTSSIVRNGSFDHGAAGWEAGTGTRLRTGRVGRSHSQGMKLVATRPGRVAVHSSTANPTSRTQAGRRYAAVTWVRSSKPGRLARLLVVADNSGRADTTSSRAVRLPDTRWHRLRAVLTAPVSGSALRVFVRVHDVRASHPAYVDSVSLRPVAASAPAAPRTLAATSTSSLLSANYDSLPLGQMTPANFIASMGSSNKNTGAYDDTTVVGDSRGGRSMRTTLIAHTIHSNPSGNNGINNFITLKRTVDNACLSYDIKFDSNFDWSYGGKLPGLLGVSPGTSPSLPTGGQAANGKGWSGRMMWLGAAAYPHVRPKLNEAVSYMYHPGQSDQYGDNIWWNKAFTAGVWHNVKTCYQMNTVGQKNGILRTWLDGTQQVNITNFVYRTRSDVAISHLCWSVFRGGHTMDWAGSRTDTIDFDNVQVTTG